MIGINTPLIGGYNMLTSEEQGSRLSITMDYVIEHGLEDVPTAYIEYSDGGEEFFKYDKTTESSSEFFF